MNQLQSQYPEVARLIENLNESQLKTVGLAVSKYVVDKLDAKDPSVLELLNESSTKNPSKLEEISKNIEEPYLAAQAKGQTDSHLKGFLQARAIDSLRYALGEHSVESTSRCIYEAIAANEGNTDEIKTVISDSIKD